MSYYYYNTVLPLLLTTGSPGQGADSLHRDHRPGQHQGQGGHCQVIQQGEQWAPGRLPGYSIINFFRWMVPILAYLTVFTYLLNSLWWGDAAVPGCWRGGAEPGGGQPPLHAGHALEPADGEPGLRQDLQVKGCAVLASDGYRTARGWGPFFGATSETVSALGVKFSLLRC